MANKKDQQINGFSIDHLISDQAMVVSARHSQDWGPLYQRLYNLYCFQYICDSLINSKGLQEIHSFRNKRRLYLAFDRGFAQFVERRLKIEFTQKKREKLISKTRTKYFTLKRRYSKVVKLKQSGKVQEKIRAQDFKEYFWRIAQEQSQNQFSKDQVEYLEQIQKLRNSNINLDEDEHMDLQMTKSQVFSCEQNGQL